MSDNRKVWAFGDSYTFGYDLSDFNDDDPRPSNLTYPALIAKHLGYDYECKAMGYYSNEAIARTIIENIDKITDQDLVLVMWTFPIRREFLMEDVGLTTIGRSADHEFAKHYLKHVDVNPGTMIDLSLRQIFLAQELLKGKDYFFLSADTDLAKAITDPPQPWTSPLISRFDRNHWVMLDNDLGFHKWSEKQLNTRYECHPNDPAHELLARKILERT